MESKKDVILKFIAWASILSLWIGLFLYSLLSSWVWIFTAFWAIFGLFISMLIISIITLPKYKILGKTVGKTDSLKLLKDVLQRDVIK
ncbi:MAG: hypothetical protein CL782_04305 [Chloroflexi bacterium]|nr:hypothetical protein [Chloroflexota bacterium]